MVTLLLTMINTAIAQEPLRNDVSIDVGISSGCLLGCINYDRHVSEKIDVGVTVTPVLIFIGGGIYGQYTLHSWGKSALFIEPSAGIIWSILSREILYNASAELGFERTINERLYWKAHLGGGVISYDLDGVDFLPNGRIGVGTRF
jgi:hypothetical protein